MVKEPKKYECLECGFISNRTKSLKFPGISFAICFKCRGRVKEREEWQQWLYERQRTIRKQVIDNNNGYLLGIDIMTAEERADKESESPK